MSAELVDAGTGRSAIQNAQNGAAYVTLVNASTGLPYVASVGSVTAPGVDGTQAQAVQGITNGVPVPVSGPLTNTQLRATAVPVSATALPLPTGASTDATLQAVRDRLPAAFATPGLLAVDTLGTPGTPRVQATGAAATSIALTATCRRISMYATQGAWYSISGAATTSSHYIATGERLDFDVPANTTISVLQETTAGFIRITELV